VAEFRIEPKVSRRSLPAAGRGKWTGKDPHEGARDPMPPLPWSRLPKGATQSPRGDLGALRAKEAKAVFPSGKRSRRGPDSARVCSSR
jgi:hypothetical protein